MHTSIKIIFLALLVTSLLACADSKETTEEPDNQFNITGQLAGYDGYVFLNYTQRGDSVIRIKDSVKVTDGSFAFTGQVDYPIEGFIHLQPPSNVKYLYIEPGDFQLYMSQQSSPTEEGAYYFPEMDSIVGSPSADLKAEFAAYRDSQKGQPDYPALMFQKVTEIITRHPDHPYSGKLLADYSLTSGFISGPEAEALLATMDTTAMDPFELKMIHTKIKKDQLFAVGQPVGDIELPGMDTDPIQLKPSRSDFTLVDFWASWCVPCVKKFPEYKEILKATSRDEFNIFGVSLDENISNWRASIEQRELNWVHVIDSLGFDGEMAKTYYILGIPRNFLIDKQGNIVDIDIQPEGLKERFLTP